MALVGEARIIVRAITNRIDGDIKRGFAGTSATGKKAGQNLGKGFTDGFNKSTGDTFTKLSNGLRSMASAADDAARQSFSNLNRTAQYLTTIIAVLVGGVFSLIGAIGALGANAIGAASSVLVLGNALFAVVTGAIAAKLALGGIGKAISAYNKQATSGGSGGGGGTTAMLAAIDAAEKALARTIESNREALLRANNDVRKSQLALNAALKAGREEIQQLGFDAEDAALNEKRAALDLDKARLALAKAQDLPPNSRVRQEAELAYQEAELNYRKAKDSAADLNKEQDRLARTGVGGTQVVINATDALAQAEAAKSKAIRDGLRSEADAQDALAKAKQKPAAGGGSAGADPFAKLNDAQKEFAKFIISLKPQFDKLKEIAANSFLPPLQQAIELLMDRAFPVVAVGIGLMGAAMGEAAKALAGAITETGNLANLAKLFETSAPLLVTIGEVLGKVWGIFLSLLVGSSGMAQQYFDFLNKRLGDFDNWLKSSEGNSAMQDFFGKAGKAAEGWGKIIDNIFGGLGGMINANLGPGTGGQYLLDWLDKATGKWAALDDTSLGAARLKSSYQDMATNSQKMLSSIGALLDELIKLGKNQSIGETFDRLAKGAPVLGEILNKFADAGPFLADLIVTVTDIINLFLDSGTAQAFFTTLNAGFTALKGFLETPFAKAINAFLAPLTGVALALGAIAKGAQLASSIVRGYIGLMGSMGKGFKTFFGTLKSGVGLIGKFAKGVGQAALASWDFLKSMAAGAKQMVINTALWIKDTAVMVAHKIAQVASSVATGIVTAAQWLFNIAVSANPIGLIIIAIIALVAAIVALVMNWDTVVKFMTDVWNGFIGWFTGVMDGFLGWWNDLWSSVGSFISDVWNNIVSFVTDAWNNIVNFFVTAFKIYIGIWIAVFTFIFNLVSDIWTNITNFFTDAWNGIAGFFKDAFDRFILVWTIIWALLSKIISDVWNNIINFIMAVVNNVVKFITDTFNNVGTFWNNFWGGVGDTVRNVWDNIINFVKGGANFVIGGIETMVNGAIDLLNTLSGALNTVIGPLGDAIGIKLKIPKVPHIKIPRLAKGGIISPSVGGSIVNVAEAGKPERVEPLDENGLSKRDKAMIAQLSSGNGVTIQVYGAPGQSVNELAEEVSRRISFTMRKGAAA